MNTGGVMFQEEKELVQSLEVGISLKHSWKQQGCGSE